MKNIVKLFGIIALVAVIGFSMVSCGDDDIGDQTPGEQTPGDQTPGDETPGDQTPDDKGGTNPVGGKAYYQHSNKIEFAESTGATAAYTEYGPRWDYDSEDYILDSNGKFQWDVEKIGTYTWNENAKTVTLTPTKLPGPGGQLLDKAGYKAAYTADINAEIAEDMEENGWTQEEFDEYISEQLAEMGYSSMAEFIDAQVDEAFRDCPYTYSFSNNGNSLFLQEVLPPPKGTDQFANTTYYGTTWDYESGHNVKNPDIKYEFGANKTYTFTTNYDSHSGSYSYDSTKKKVYFSRVKVDGKTAAEYYETVVVEPGHHFINDDAYKASQTNAMYYFYDEDSYDPTLKLIGSFDD